MATSLHPELLWAQRSSESDAEKNIVYLTVNLPDIVESSLKYDLSDTGFSISAKTGNHAKGIPEKEYAASIEFFAEVDPDLTKKSFSSRSLTFVLRKKEKKAAFWPRLTKEKVKLSFVKTDFSKWVDEDEQDGVIEIPEDDGLGGMGGGGLDPSMLAGLGGGAGGPGGMDFSKMMESMGGAGGAGGFDPSSLGSGGAPGGDDSDDDDDGPPPLEATDEAK